MNSYPNKFKRGVIVYRHRRKIPIEDRIGSEKAAALGKSGEIIERSHWEVDREIPLFSKDPTYIEKFLE